MSLISWSQQNEVVYLAVCLAVVLFSVSTLPVKLLHYRKLNNCLLDSKFLSIHDKILLS